METSEKRSNIIRPFTDTPETVPEDSGAPESTTQRRTESLAEVPFDTYVGTGYGFYPASGGGGDSMEPRIAKLESDVEHIKTDISDIKIDVRDFRKEIGDLKEKVSNTKVWISAFGFSILVAIYGAANMIISSLKP